MTDVRILTESLGGSPLSLLLQRGGAPARLASRPRPSDAEGWRERAARARGRARLGAIVGRRSSRRSRRRAPRRRGSSACVARVASSSRPGSSPDCSAVRSTRGARRSARSRSPTRSRRRPASRPPPVFWAATDDADFARGVVDGRRARSAARSVLQQRDRAAGRHADVARAARRRRARSSRDWPTACGSAADHRAARRGARARTRDARDGRWRVRRAAARAARAARHRRCSMRRIPAVHGGEPASTRDGAATRQRRSSARSRARATELRAAGYRAAGGGHAGALARVRPRGHGSKRRLAVGRARRRRRAVLTPNVLLRPIVEQAILPTVAYCGRSGRARVLRAGERRRRRRWSWPAPLAVPRWSCTLLEPHVEAVLDRLGLQRDDLSDAARRRASARARGDGRAHRRRTRRAARRHRGARRHRSAPSRTRSVSTPSSPARSRRCSIA